MEYRQMGNSGVRVSIIGLGANRFGSDVVSQKEVDKIIGGACELGINFIDTANTYVDGRSEETLGHALKGRSDRFVLATKFSFPKKDGSNTWGASRYQMMQAVEASLRRLQIDHIDLYYVHRWDETTPIEETLRGLDDLVRMGKVCYVGASAFASWQLAYANVMADLRGWTPFVVVQSEYHMLKREVEREVLPYCQAHKVGFVPYFPLAGGFLTGKYKRGKPSLASSRGAVSGIVRRYMKDAYYDKIEHLAAFAEARGRSVNDLAHAWLLAQPRVCSVISGATKLEQMLSNAKAADWVLDADELKGIDGLLATKPDD